MESATLPRSPRVIGLRPPGRALTCVLEIASEADRAQVAALRHDVYARELGQHPVNATGRLGDGLDAYNIVLVARMGGAVAGFVSLTPPRCPAYSIDKYFPRADLPFSVDDSLFEVRLLTVLPEHRGSEIALLLMYAALRWVESHGGTHVAAIGRREVVPLYERVGLRPMGLSARSGAVTYDLLHATATQLRAQAVRLADLFGRLERHIHWRLSFPFRQPAGCFHGGAFFAAVGEDFQRLERRHEIINADVLDAWFDPAPGVLRTLQAEMPWLLRTSPPTACAGLVETIARTRGVLPANILPGAGSSDLIFRAFTSWLTPRSRVLILDPTYGEYAHVLEHVVGCRVDRLPLDRAANFAVEPARLEAAFADGYDLIVLVNPNSPTGRHLPRATLELMVGGLPPGTRLWIDETYVEYAGAGQSMEQFAAQSENIVVCKSMSKVYALSGARVAYLCAGRHQLEALRAITPPWVVGLPSQVAAVRALQDPAYYAGRYRETALAREILATGLRGLGWDVLPGIANFLLCHLPASGPDAATVVARAAARGLFIRNAATMGARLGPHAVRVAVKDPATNRRMIEILHDAADLR
ncbi:MAG TPA: histidinol-phosphate aminotransferase family protein [Candidatus Didemnitutus sp.]|nr:histidinol-phosphate aminotransferase family protein [Candidatus Didemnitutus sp.]